MSEILLNLKREFVIDPHVKEVVDSCIDIAFNQTSKYDLGIRLAATFDMMVSVSYYKSVSNRGWTYCSDDPQMMFYTYTNVCPRCRGNGRFVYAKANKPESGKIGLITTEILCVFYQNIFTKKGHNVEVFKASEPVDVIVHDIKKDMFLLAEVKAAPLLTIPLAAKCETITEMRDGVLIRSGHETIDNPFLRSSSIGLYFPAYNKKKERFYPLELDWGNEACYYDAILKLMKNADFFENYLDFWYTSYNAYIDKNREVSLYWLTNACGSPFPIPEGWPKRVGTGYESVSDSKTSAGMDRTDDIKKGIYQVLKIGAEYKTTHKNIKTAIISNLPALRHYDEYLLTIKDIVWTISKEPFVSSLKDMPLDTPIYNLFDGIISLTKSDIRDPWIKGLLS